MAAASSTGPFSTGLGVGVDGIVVSEIDDVLDEPLDGSGHTDFSAISAIGRWR